MYIPGLPLQIYRHQTEEDPEAHLLQEATGVDLLLLLQEVDCILLIPRLLLQNLGQVREPINIVMMDLFRPVYTFVLVARILD